MTVPDEVDSPTQRLPARTVQGADEDPFLRVSARDAPRIGARAAWRPGAALVAGRYRIEGLLGRGAMGEVHAAVDLRLGRGVALKVLGAGLSADPRARARFSAEASAAARLSHPNVVTVFDVGEWEGRPFLVMERLPGRSLLHRLGAGPLPEPEALALACDLLRALGAAHAAGVLHRDVKPGNVLFAEDGSAKLADFGVAKAVEARDAATTSSGTVLGTLPYLAPERLAGAPATPASDLWSLGVVLYEALSGTRPFEAPSALEAAMLAKDRDAQPLAARAPWLEPELAAVVDRALAREPERRFRSAAEMAAALDAAVGCSAAGASTAAAGPLAAGGAVGPARPVGRARARGRPSGRARARGRPSGRARRLGFVGALAASAVVATALRVAGSSHAPPADHGESGAARAPATASVPSTTVPSAVPEGQTPGDTEDETGVPATHGRDPDQEAGSARGDRDGARAEGGEPGAQLPGAAPPVPGPLRGPFPTPATVEGPAHPGGGARGLDRDPAPDRG